jgi:hypothetical protein
MAKRLILYKRNNLLYWRCIGHQASLTKAIDGFLSARLESDVSVAAKEAKKERGALAVSAEALLS